MGICGAKQGERIQYSWGNGFPNGKIGGNIADESAKRLNPGWTIFKGYDDGYANTAQVASYEPNALGLYDMTGNVFEWCADWYGQYGETSQPDPQGPDSGSYRVLRGYSWINDSGNCRTTNRFKNNPKIWCDCYGFRVVR
jgi:formylglycine-generating enzyme required for sulfatase activity